MTTYTVDIPEAFASDHYERELPTGERVKMTAKLWTFRCTVEELKEWASDADYYSDAVSMMGPEYFGLQCSARATVKRVAKALGGST